MVELFSPFSCRGVIARNRIVISPMQQYAAGKDGFPTPWHRNHLERLAIGGPGIVFTEALAVEIDGRATHADLGIWCDEQSEALALLARTIASYGALPGAQLIHAGRKASVQVPWEGYQSLTDADASRGSPPWRTVAPSPLPANPGWQVPEELSIGEIGQLVDAFAAGARRLHQAGFRVLDIHGAHGYLIHSFLSPLSNLRTDRYGNGLAGRMRFALEIAEAVRGQWPEDLPIFYRLSCIDDLPGGWTLADTEVLARELGARGIDVIDCSSRGLAERGTLTPGRTPGFQVPFAEQIRRNCGLPTMAVGLITDPVFANQIIEEGRADLVAIGRESLFNPHWPMQAAVTLGHDPSYTTWPKAYGWWLHRRDRGGHRPAGSVKPAR